MTAAESFEMSTGTHVTSLQSSTTLQ